MFILAYNFKTTATRSKLTAGELDQLGLRRVNLVRINIYEENGSTFTTRICDDLVKHLWTVLGQNLDNLERFQATRIPRRGCYIKYKTREQVHLPHISELPRFDFFQESGPDPRFPDHEFKLTVFQAILLGNIEE